MSNKRTFNIVCPIYKPLDKTEKLSLKSLFDRICGSKTVINGTEYIIPKYDVWFIMPDSDYGSAPDYYTSIIDYINKELHIYYKKDTDDTVNGFRCQFYPKDYFISTQSYSDLLLRDWFYKEWLCQGYEYTYMYQTDCYLFRDELQYFVDLRFDYIGSPVIATNSDWGMYGHYVGNGGFSLRNNRTFMRVLYRESDCWKAHKDILENTRLPKNSDKRYIDFEDIFICKLLSRYTYINIAPIDIAYRFSWDRNADVCFERNNDVLPMACHQWLLQHEFYKTYIPELKNNKAVDDICKKKLDEFINAYHPELEGYGN